MRIQTEKPLKNGKTKTVTQVGDAIDSCFPYCWPRSTCGTFKWLLNEITDNFLIKIINIMP